MEQKAICRPLTYEESHQLLQLDEEMQAAMDKVAQLEFSMLGRKLMEERGWTQEYCEEVEGLYRKFLALNVEGVQNFV